MGNMMLEFELSAGRYAVISAAGLMDGEQFMVEYLACADCENSYWIPYSPCGEPILIDEYYNPVTVATAGRYRVLSLGERSKTSKVCHAIYEE